MYTLQQIKNTIHILETPFTENVTDYIRLFIQTSKDLNSTYLINLSNKMENYKLKFINKYVKLTKEDFTIIKYALEYVFINNFVKIKSQSIYRYFIEALENDLSPKLAKYINEMDFLFLSAAFIFLCTDIDCKDDIAHIKNIETFNARNLIEYISILKENKTIIT